MSDTINARDIEALINAAREQGEFSQAIAERFAELVDSNNAQTECLNNLHSKVDKAVLDSKMERQEFQSKMETMIVRAIYGLAAMVLGEVAVIVKLVMALTNTQ